MVSDAGHKFVDPTLAPIEETDEVKEQAPWAFNTDQFISTKKVINLDDEIRC